MVSKVSYIPSITERADYYALGAAARHGTVLPSSSAKALEMALSVNQEDLVSRARLLGYYSKLADHDNSAPDKVIESKLRHVIWFMANAPDCVFAGDTWLSISRDAHPKHYKRAKEAWLEAVEAKPGMHQVAINSAIFFLQSEPKLSRKLLKQVQPAGNCNAWVSFLLDKLDKTSKASVATETDIPPRDFNYAQWRENADKMFLETVVFHGTRMPPMSAQTLELVVARFPNDLSARAELIGFYSNRWKRSNVLGLDPECLCRLATHLLWCIRRIPGSRFVGYCSAFTDIATGPSFIASERLAEAWKETANLVSNEPWVRARAEKYFNAAGTIKTADKRPRRSKTMGLRRATVKRNIQETHETQELDADGELRNALANAAVSLSVEHPECPFGPYTLAEWSSEIDLSGADLEGVYHWVPANSIAHIELVLERDSVDIYNRAKIIGFYNRYLTNSDRQKSIAAALSKKQTEFVHERLLGMKRPSVMSLNIEQAESHVRHMLWFIENIPESRYIGTFYFGQLKEHQRQSYVKMRKALDQMVKTARENVDILINVAAALIRCDDTESLRLADKIAKTRPEWGARIKLMSGERIPDVDVKAALDKHMFRAGTRRVKLLKIAKLLDRKRQILWARFLPVRTIWATEYALRNNPNDLMLRIDLLEAYDQLDQFSTYYDGNTPDVLPQAIEHMLWLIQNVPDYINYSGIHPLKLEHKHHRQHKPLGAHDILFDAARQQLKAYPESLAIALSMTHYFPLGSEQDSLKALRKVKRLYPNNRPLKQRLDHLRSMINRSKSWPTPDSPTH